MSVRARFAPSPTGYLHVGGARTAIFNWLFARHAGGTFLLRIEDTDRERSRDEHTRTILDGLSWLGLDWDEEPLFQSSGVERHRADALRLLAEGKAYRDFSAPEEVRAEAEARGVHPSAVARERADALGVAAAEARAAAGEPFAVRFRVPEGETRFTDMVHGEMRFGNADVDDLVILRSDGTPVYNLAVVSDDAHQRVTHVIRGDDHLSNTPKQVLLYRALGLPEPVFGHVPLILGMDGKRLSKRHGATAVGDYAGEGILPEAMLNFLALLGWSPGDDREILTRDELVAVFDMSRVLKKSAVFDVEKLAWMNARHLAMRPTPEIVRALRERWTGAPDLDAGFVADSARMENLVEVLKPRSKTLDDLSAQAAPFVLRTVTFDADAVAKHLAKDPEGSADKLQRLTEALAGCDWTEPALEGGIRALADAMGVGAGKLIHPLRVSLTGSAASPGIFEVLVLLGRERSLERIRGGVEMVGAHNKRLS